MSGNMTKWTHIDCDKFTAAEVIEMANFQRQTQQAKEAVEHLCDAVAELKTLIGVCERVVEEWADNVELPARLDKRLQQLNDRLLESNKTLDYFV